MNKFTVLLVDDVKENIFSLKLLIEDSFDVKILTSLSAHDAMKILMEERVDLILSDIQMPDIDGFQFAEYIKSVDKLKEIPIIFITGIYDKDNYQKKGYDLGAVEYISKPIDDLLLSSKLKVYIDLYENMRENNEALVQKDEMLIHQSKMATMGEMIGVISHQLKQPLNVMSLYCADIKTSYSLDEIDDKFIKEFHENTKEQISFMTETIDGFMDFFNPKKEKRIFTFKEVLKKTLNLLAKQMENNNINIISNIGDEEVYGVQSELQQVLLNLITNAKDAFIEKNIQKREISFVSLKKEKYSVLIVEDNAGGIGEEDLEKVFNPYFTTKEYGTGTGLYMVKLVIKSSFHGNLKVQNTKDGIKFIIILPSFKLN